MGLSREGIDHGHIEPAKRHLIGDAQPVEQLEVAGAAPQEDVLASLRLFAKEVMAKC